MRKLLACFMILFGTLSCHAQTYSAAGQWNGLWTNPAGYIFSAEVTLDDGSGCVTCAVLPQGLVQGKILWTLRKAGDNATPRMLALVGHSATEFLRGELKSGGLLILYGYQKDDPESMIGLDRYRLAIGETGKTIGGITGNNGNWMGQFLLVRKEN